MISNSSPPTTNAGEENVAEAQLCASPRQQQQGLVEEGSVSDRVPSLSPPRRHLPLPETPEAELDSTTTSSTSTTIPHPSSPINIDPNPLVSSSPSPLVSTPAPTRARGALASLNRLRIASTTSASTQLSPAASFLSSFGSGPRSRDVSLSSASGRFAALVDGDEEGYHVAGYVLGKELGRGGFGVVREAIKVGGTRAGEKVAVKVVRHRQPSAVEQQLPPVSLVGEALRRSASGYQRGGKGGLGAGNRDRRMSLVLGNEGRDKERWRSSSSPMAPPFAGLSRTDDHHLQSRGESTPAPSSRTPPTADDPSILSTSASGALEPSPLLDPPASTTTTTSDEPPSLIQALLTREIHLWRQLSPHPHIVQLISTHSTDDFTYIFMPLCEGGNLLDFLNGGGVNRKRRKEREEREREKRRRGGSFGIAGTMAMASSMMGSDDSAFQDQDDSQTIRKGLPLHLARTIFGQLVEGLHYLHTEAGVTHRDIKLDNILCDEYDAAESEGGGTWKIADFGLAESASLGAGRMEEVAKGAAAAVGAREASRSRPSSRASSPTKPKRPRMTPHHSASTGSGHITPGLPLASLSRANSLSRPDSCTSLSSNLPLFDTIDHHLHPAGSLPYSTPEQMRSPVPILEPSGDVWAAGCVLYALVQGELPFMDEFEPRLRTKVMKGVWEVPSNLLLSAGGGGGTGEEEQRCLEVLRGCLEVDPTRRWTIKQIRDSTWLRPPPPPPSPFTRGRPLSRGPPFSRNPSSSRSRQPSSASRSGSEGLAPHSSAAGPAPTRRKERSSSRSSAAIKHLGISERTRSNERHELEKEERKMRWDRSRSSVRDGSGSGVRTGSRSSTRGGRARAGTAGSRESEWEEGSRGRSRERAGGFGVGEGRAESREGRRDVFDLREVSREAERLGRVLEPY
ncbi:kinase-like domain-containing protein [Leucosporidium creatinivorum]|uniref:Kinase-like domain-containing protein n=1 Tax=Leucosporidium creatinivorum TaxID=106004 RepID=A0A1Y2EZF3_9BASI|nr:kinase-like domain-containing protein [Leucosporidium creatinivorum]